MVSHVNCILQMHLTLRDVGRSKFDIIIFNWEISDLHGRQHLIQHILAVATVHHSSTDQDYNGNVNILHECIISFVYLCFCIVYIIASMLYVCRLYTAT